jgi:dienelactone hydrolase
MKKWILLSLLFSGFAHAALHQQQVDYRAGDTALKGYLVWDDAFTGKRPGILVVHEFWGLNDYARKRAVLLAELGYTALAVDMYGEGKVAEHPKEASEFMNAVLANADAAKARFLAARQILAEQATVDSNKIAAIGYCFGGATVLTMARAGVDLKAVVSFHGLLSTKTPAQPGQVKARILVETGADDKMAPAADIAAFNQEMTAAGAKYHMDVYPGAKHSFTNPDADEIARRFDLPVGYNAEADKKSWQAMQKLFKEVFAG